MKALIIAIAIVFVAGVAGFFVYGTCCDDYSSGDRVGVITKFSRKGIFFKTWEGEMNLGGVTAGPGGDVVPNIWRFSIDENAKRGEEIDKLAKLVQDAQETGARMKVHYEQELLVAPWRADEEYLLQSVEVLGK